MGDKHGRHGLGVSAGPYVQYGRSLTSVRPIDHSCMAIADLVDGKREVVPAHAHADPRGGAHPEQAFDVIGYFLCRCGREGNPSSAGVPIAQLANGQVVCPKRMPPLAHAMRFIHCDRPHIHGATRHLKIGQSQPLRGHKQETAGTKPEIVQHPLHLLAVHACR